MRRDHDCFEIQTARISVAREVAVTVDDDPELAVGGCDRMGAAGNRVTRDHIVGATDRLEFGVPSTATLVPDFANTFTKL